jgi:hypothetical protein
MNLADFWETQKVLEEFDRDVVTPIMGSQPLVPPAVDLGPVARLCQAPKPGPCYICCRMSTTMFIDKTPMCVNCAFYFSEGLY